MIMETTKKAYKDIFKVLNKHKDICVFDIKELERKANLHLFGLELKEVYGLNIDPVKIERADWLQFGDKTIAWYGEKYNRKISWSVDGRQPKDELLFTVGFSSGAFLFGYGGMFNRDYPVEFFQKFWLELKSFSPDYVDEANHCLYWKLENAKEIFNAYDDILKKYHELNKEDIKKRQIEKMKKDLEKLENETTP